MRIFTKQLLVAARRSILVALSAALAVSTAVAEPAGIHYSDFIKYGELAHAPLTGGEDFNVAAVSPALTAAESTPRGVYLGFVGLLAAIIVLATNERTGKKGKPGQPGEAGEAGEAGQSGEQGERGEQGQSGEAGQPGQSGNQGLSGRTGLQGNPGERGETGDNFLSSRTCALNGISDIKPTVIRAPIDHAAAASLMAGAVVTVTIGMDNTIYRVYTASDGNLYFAEGAVGDGIMEACHVDGSERFFLDTSYMETTIRALARDNFEFSLRTAWRGLISGSAVRMGSFMVSQNSDLRNTHIEHQATAFAAGAFALHTDSGWRRFDSGNSTMTYAKTTATWDLNPAVQLYAQNTGGWLNSSEYANGRLQAQAFGVFADKVLRHDDSYHLRLESPLADSRAQIWRLAADTSIGTAADYLRLGLHHQINGNKTGMRIFYSREF